MKKIFALIAMLVWVTTANAVLINKPNTTTFPPGTPARITFLTPYDSLLSIPALFNYTRTWMPSFPVTDSSGFTYYYPTNAQVSSTYTNGFGQALQASVKALVNDIVQPYDIRTSLTQNGFLPYPATTNTGFQMEPFKAALTYYNNLYAHEGGDFYTQSVSSFSNQIPTVKTYSAGASFVGEGRGDSTVVTFNTTADSIVNYSYDDDATGLQGYGTYYAANQLSVKITYGQHSSIVKMFYNKNNQLLVKKAYTGSQWLSTYYIYDFLGKIRYVFTPRAVAAGITAVNLSSLAGLYYYYTYDNYGNPVLQQESGKSSAGLVVYDNFERPVLLQTPLMLAQHKWQFKIYDSRDRVVMSGILNDGITQDSIQKIMNGTYTLPTGKAYDSLMHMVMNGFNGNYPDSIPECNTQQYNYYDNYSWNSIIVSRYFDSSYSTYYNTSIYDVKPQPYLFTQGMLTATKTLVQDPTNTLPNRWVYSVYYYDQKGHLIQAQTLNSFNPYSGTAHWDVTTTQYSFKGQKEQDIIKHYAWAAANKASTLVRNVYTYNPITGWLTDVNQSIDGGALRAIASYTYDALGHVTTKMIGGTEQQDYQYNIRGQLTSINSDYLETPSSFTNKTFGDSLSYDYGYVTPRYDGSISGMQWRGASTGTAIRSYGYNYDQMGRISGADLQELSGSGVWNNVNTDFTVSNVTYDANGNLLTMNQMGTSTTGPVKMDVLSYTYNTNSNQLQKVADTVKTNYHLGDFFDGTNTGADYSYDADGNLASDSNKHISSITYNEYDLPTAITTNTGNIKNEYSGSGALLQKTITQGSHTDTFRYWGPFVYKNDSLQLVFHDEGRARYEPDSTTFKYDYFVKDHLGNVRTVVTSDVSPDPVSYFASHELASAALESSIFAGIENVRDTRPYGGAGDEYAANLNGSDSTRAIGTSMLLSVMPGDKFDAGVSTYWSAASTAHATANTMLNDIISTLVGQAGGYNSGDNPATYVNSLFTTPNYVGTYDAIINAATDSTIPPAYLNYLVFDASMHLVASQSGAIQIGATANSWQAVNTLSSIEINQPGYVAIYISNEGNSNVYFDHFTVSHYKGRILQEQHYYPFGLAINIGEQTGADNVHNQYLYQQKKLQDEMGVNLYDFHLRQQDAQIGRFCSLDPANQFHSGYTSMGNDPANMIDPNGAWSNVPQGYNPLAPQGSKYNIQSQYVDAEQLFGDKQIYYWGHMGGISFMIYAGSVEADGTRYQGDGALLYGKIGVNIDGKLGVWTLRNRTERPGYDPVVQAGLAGQGSNVEGYGNNEVVGTHFIPLNNKMSETEWYEPGSKANALFTAATAGLEKMSGIARAGSNYRLYLATQAGRVFEGNQYVRTIGLSKVGGILGRVGFGIGVLMDLKGVANYYDDPNGPNAVAPGKAGVNTAMGAWGLTGLGLAPSLLYFGIDNTIGWPNAMNSLKQITDEEQYLIQQKIINYSDLK